ncbi:MAG: permease [Bacteroidales bacterium]
MDAKIELKNLFYILFFFAIAYYMPLESARFQEAIAATLDLVRWYAQEHVILCLIPAFFIAGVIAVFVSQGSVIKYFGAQAKKWVAYSVASVSGTILAVCSCTILPLFSSIHQRGAGLGPAMAFLYSGPAINILAIILTARILGWELGLARVIGAIVFAVVIGLIMAYIFRKEEQAKKEAQMNIVPPPEKRPLWQTSLHFFTLVLILVFANWGRPAEGVDSGGWYLIWSHKWYITGFFGLILAYSLISVLKIKWWKIAASVLAVSLAGILFSDPMVPFIVAIAALAVVTLTSDEENREWTISTWGFTKQIMPLLALGVIVAGFLFGSTHENSQLAGIIPDHWISSIVGGNSLWSNLFASVLGAFMYFATLTEVPILQGLIASGMGQGPALALLLAGPSLSLPNMLVIQSVIGTKKTAVFVGLVVVMATISGLIYGAII